MEQLGLFDNVSKWEELVVNGCVYIGRELVLPCPLCGTGLWYVKPGKVVNGHRQLSFRASGNGNAEAFSIIVNALGDKASCQHTLSDIAPHLTVYITGGAFFHIDSYTEWYDDFATLLEVDSWRELVI